MSRALVECVPNFSEGRDPRVVEAIADAMRLPGVSVLDQEMDADHNRSVITLAGEPQALVEAVLQGVGKATELIDLTCHRGVHPRMGATDVVPFIPMEGITLDECAGLARQAGEAIASRFGIPVYLYEAAATRPERKNLENLRRGQFEGIRDEIATLPERKPDFGPSRVHPTAGAVAVGARKFLIAYNIYLDSAELEIAQKVARTVRTSSGGLPCIKASGFLVRDQAQVSMNLTDFEQTSVYRIFQAVQTEAARYGVRVFSSELIGLIPKLALEQAAASFLQIENFHSAMILENRLAVAQDSSLPRSSGDAGEIARQIAAYARDSRQDRLIEELIDQLKTLG